MQLGEIFQPLREWGSAYNPIKAHRMLLARGWYETTVQGTYKNVEVPGYSIDVDAHSVIGKGPFAVFHGSRKINQLAYVPYPQQIAAMAA
jgi:hypothetical protein